MLPRGQREGVMDGTISPILEGEFVGLLCGMDRMEWGAQTGGLGDHSVTNLGNSGGLAHAQY